MKKYKYEYFHDILPLIKFLNDHPNIKVVSIVNDLQQPKYLFLVYTEEK